MYRSLTKLLLVIYGLSVISNSLLDASHEVLHCLRNAIHHHEHLEHHHIHDHHAFLKKDAQLQVYDSETNLPILSYFIFFENFRVFDLLFADQITFQAVEIITRVHCGYTTLLLDPPLF
ncbi:MAG: hypothetical protein C0490_21280 [Marivirga sp.]|nr:hypothetical protein [Marivirga sp.]